MADWDSVRAQNRTFTSRPDAAGNTTQHEFQYNFVSGTVSQQAETREQNGFDQLVVPQPPAGEWTTISDIAEAILRANEQSVTDASLNQLMDQLIDENNLKDAYGAECDGAHRNNAMIWPGQVLKVPDDYIAPDSHPPLNVEFHTLRQCPPIVNAAEAPVVLELIATQARRTEESVVLETQQRVALVRYPGAGALGEAVDGLARVTEIQDALNMPMLVGHMPEQPDVAARGNQRRSTGMQTTYGTGSRVVGEVIKHGAPLLLSFTGAGIVWRPLILDHTWGPQSADRIMDARQGSNATNMQTAGESYGFDLFGRSSYTNLNGTLLPGLGVDMRADGRIVDDGTSPHNNNQAYYGAQRNGSDLPNMTFAERDFDDNPDNDRNTRLWARPSDAVGLYGLSNYGNAQFIFGELNAVAGQVNPATGRISPHDGEVTELQRKMDTGEASQADYQRYVNLMRFQQELVGISNYDITSQAEIQSILEADQALRAQYQQALGAANNNPGNIPEATANSLIEMQQATAERVALLNPREQLELRAQQAEAAARASNFNVNMNTKGDDLMPQDGADQAYPNNYPVRSVNQAQMREQLLEYYTVMALTQEDAFQDMVERETRGVAEATLREVNPNMSSRDIRRAARRRDWRPDGVNEREGLEGYQIFNQLREQLRTANPGFTDRQIREEAMRLAQRGGTIGTTTIQPMEDDLWEDLEPVLTQTARFVDNYTIAKDFPENGVDLAHMDRLYRHPEERFSRVERFQDLATTGATPSREDALRGAGEVLAASPTLTAMLLEASAREPLMAQAWAYFDDGTVQRPAQYGMGGWDRSDEMQRLRDRGYSEDLMAVTFSREETQGVVRDFDTVRRDLAASADRTEVVARRQEDLRLMLTGGTDPDNNQGVLRGQHMEDVLYALAAEPDNATLEALEEEINTTQGNNASAMIEALRQGVDYARNERMENRVGITHDDLQRTIARQELGRDALGKVNASRSTNAQPVRGEEAAAIIAADAADGVADGRSTVTTNAVDTTVRATNLQHILDHLSTEQGAPGMVKVAELAGVQEPETTEQLYRALASLTPNQRAEVFTEGRIAGDAAQIWAQVQAEQVVTTVTTVEGQIVRSQDDEEYVNAYTQQTGAERTANLLRLYMNDSLTEQYAFSAVTSSDMLFANAALAPQVVMQNQNNAAFMGTVTGALRATGGDVEEQAEDLRSELRSQLRRDVREGLAFTNREDYVPRKGDISVNVQSSRWTYTLTLPASLSNDPRVQNWMHEIGGTEAVEQFMREAIRGARVSSGTARGRMRDVERAVERAIIREVVPSEAELITELETEIPSLNLANILEAVQNGESNAPQRLHDFMAAAMAEGADPAMAAAAQQLVGLVAANDPDGLYAAWQNVVNAYAADVNADPFNLAGATPPATVAQMASVRDALLGHVVGSIATQDPTNSAALSAATQALLNDAPVIPNGFYIPFLIIPTGRAGNTPEGRVPEGGPIDPPIKPGDDLVPPGPLIPPRVKPPSVPGLG